MNYFFIVNEWFIIIEFLLHLFYAIYLIENKTNVLACKQKSIYIAIFKQWKKNKLNHQTNFLLSAYKMFRIFFRK